VDVWFQDEARVGQQGSQTRIWAKKGTRPRVVKQQQFLYEYIFGAVCPSQKTCAAVVVPYANHEGLIEHLNEISHHVPVGRHAVIIMDQAGWHHKIDLCIPSNITIIHLPPYSPELNPQEQVWQHLKDTYLANRVFKDHKEIVDACCKAWNSFAQMPEFIKSLTERDWAVLG
jgi:transposase